MKLRKPTAPYAAGAKIGLTTILTSTMSTNMPGDNDIRLGISKFAYGLNSLCFMNKTLLNIGLALAVALFLCLLPLPYGYYSILRVAVTVYAVCLAAGYYKSGNTALCVVSSCSSLLPRYISAGGCGTWWTCCWPWLWCGSG